MSSALPLFFRILVGVLVAATAIAGQLVLDATVAPEPWYIATFVAVLVGSFLAGPAAGLLATCAIAALELVVGPPVAPPELADRSAAIELVAGLIAVATGGAMRATRFRERQSIVTAAVATQASIDRDRRWQVVTGAIGEFASLGSPLQVQDALVRHATRLTGIAVRFVEPSDTRPERDPRNVLSVPVPGADGNHGVLELEPDRPLADALPDDDQLGLAALAALAGAGLDRIRLRSTSGTSLRSATRSGERLQRLEELTSELAALVTPESIGDVVVGHGLELMRARVGLFYLTDAAGELRLAHARGYPIGLAGSDARLTVDARLPATDAVRDGRAVIVSSPAEWRRLYPGASDRLGMTGTRAVTAWPIGSPPTAVLVIQRAEEGQPSDDELGQLGVLGNQAMQAIERARIYAREREARQLQEAFVGVMSHELRTPITTILAGSKLLARDRTMGTRSRDLAGDIEAEADRLFRLVEDLLVLSRLERGSLSVGDEPVHLVRILQRVIASEAARWPATRFVPPAERTGHLVRGDETYVEQVLRNLLTNAAKYSPAGSDVHIAMERQDEEVFVRVLDLGPGVSDAEVERLFGLFYRSPTTAASAAGAGIGLFVCRRLVGAMGGRVWARPRDGGGSEFGFALARYPDDEPDVEAEPPELVAPRGRRRAGPQEVAAAVAETGDNGDPTGGAPR